MDIITLREMLESELSSGELTPIDESFYSDYNSLLKALKLSVENSRERGENVEEMLYLEQLRIAESLMREILRIRLHKLVDLVFSGSPAELVEEEKRIYLLLRAFVEGEQKKLLELGISQSAKETPEGIVNTQEEEGKGRSVVSEAYIVLQELPKILDENMREYGPFKAWDLAVLPKSLGEVLLKRGAARKIFLRF